MKITKNIFIFRLHIVLLVIGVFSEFISYQHFPMTFPLAKYLTLLPPTPFCVYKVHFNSSVSILIKKKWIKKN